MNDDILLQVMKPARYIGREWNVACKDFDAAAIKFALCFPDLYEVGMSNLGIRILYGILNREPDIICERFFSPAHDMEDKLRQNHRAFTSLEHRKGLSEFDIVGFSLGYELSYTNVLAMLDLGGIPLESAQRLSAHPLVIGGGTCALNPEPIADFFDCFIIGEGEEVILEVIRLYRLHRDAFKQGKLSRGELLTLFSGIAGVYVPSLYGVRYDDAGGLIDMKPKKAGIPPSVTKRFVCDFDTAFFPVNWIVPYIEIIHDRITLELMRGCPNRCHFCQARSQYHPLRIRKAETIMRLANEAYAATGYEEMSLMGLSVSDYPNVEALVTSLVDMFKERCVSVSLPSMKPRRLIGTLSSTIARTKKTGLTFAPEAGTLRLRQFLNKQFDVAAFLSGMEEAYLAGYQRVKLYFMIGLPQETESDLDGILDLAGQVSEARKKVARWSAHVTVSINALIPKPHTPFQWLAMEDAAHIQAKQAYLVKKNRNRNVALHFHNSQMGYLEGILSRGDRRLCPVIARAFAGGARFDAWDDYFNFQIWLDAFRACSCDPVRYVQARASGSFMPWDFIDIGIDKRVLRQEYEKIIAAE